jgi:hypothetical protein
MPSATVTSKPAGLPATMPGKTSWITSLRISSSGRLKTASTSTRLTMPIRRPAALTTGSLLTRRSYMSRAASTTEASGLIVTAGAVIRSAAVTPAALSSSLMCRSAARMLVPSASAASLTSRSPADTTPITRPASSMTGNALIRELRSIAAMSLNDASFRTEMTRVVMMSLTVDGTVIPTR